MGEALDNSRCKSSIVSLQELLKPLFELVEG